MKRRFLIATVAAAAIGGALYLVASRSHEPAVAGGPLTVTIAGEPLVVPPDWIRFGSQRRSGAASRLDLGLTWPDLQPEPRPGSEKPASGTTPAAAPSSADAAAAAEAGLAKPVLVFAIEPRPTELDMAGRLGTVYARFILPDALDAPDGLSGRKLAAGSGYEDEELYFEPGAVRPFVARCFPLERKGPIGTCLTDLNIGRGLNLSMRFPRALLPEWHALRQAAETVSDRLLTEAGSP
jgi:hypothetical protein